MKDYLKTYSSIYLRDNKQGSGFQFDFMLLIRNGIDYPFINIYYFPDNSANHEHYIINLEGKLEVCHRNLKSNYYNKKTNSKEKIFIALMYNLGLLKNLKYVGDIDDFRRYFHLLFDLKYGGSLEYLKMEKRCKEYAFLMKNAISKYSNDDEISLNKLILIIKYLKEFIPDSDKNIKKKSIIKRKNR